MRENNFRRVHRQLQRHYSRNAATPKAIYQEDCGDFHDSSLSASDIHSCAKASDLQENSEQEHDSVMLNASQFDISDVNQFRVFDSKHSGETKATAEPFISKEEDVPAKSLPRTSFSSNTMNPFRKQTMKPDESIGRDESPRSNLRSAWDDLLFKFD